ncbi:hypothetical protein ILYODFUR_033462 [Ilyodon furcidens]|uniref:Thiaminase-2/PQQC domain-containing protein n=1 Tax=Ilyodon furcidens TaxID=33524 RepID=A0ABV0UBW1_9TELE
MSTGPTCLNDVYDRLWIQNQDIAQQTLKVPFLQHMQSGDLKADVYVRFMIQDINYLVKVTEMLKKMCERNMSPDIYLFMVDRYKSYKKYADATLAEFNLSGVSEIKPIPTMEKYLSNYKTIMNEEEPIFFAVALLPCERLWIWLANRLQEKESNAYFTWKMDNMQGHPEEHFRKLLDDHLKTTEQFQKASKVFCQQMQNEHNFFGDSLQQNK